MKRKLVPIKTIIKKVEQLSAYPNANKKQLIKYSNLLKSQKQLVSRISINKIKNKLKTDLSFEEYCKYKDLLQEKKNYIKYESTINNIINKNFKAINRKRRFKRRRLTAGVLTGVTIAAISTLGYMTLIKNLKDRTTNNNIASNTTTETTTEEPTTQVTTIKTTETTTESTTKATTKSTTEATTQSTTENTTEATTEKTAKPAKITTKKEEPTTVSYTIEGQLQSAKKTDEDELKKHIEEYEIKNAELINIKDEENIELKNKIEDLENKQKELEDELNKQKYNNETESTTEATTESTTEATTEVTTENTTESTTETTTQSTTENKDNSIETTVVTDDYVEFEDDIIDYSKFEGLKDFYDKASDYIYTMEDTLIDEEKRNEAKENAKGKVIEYIDFIFYGKEIDGVTFNDLKDEEKQKTYERLQKMDEVISEKDPDYKENFGERYNRVKDFSSTTLNSAKDKIKEKVGDDYYNQAGQIKDDTIDSVKEAGNIIKLLLSDKYNEWKNKGN